MRGGLSKDPEARKRQLAALAAGRKVRDTRRAEGLPARKPGKPAASPEPVPAVPGAKPRVVDGSYAKGRAAKAKKPRQSAPDSSADAIAKDDDDSLETPDAEAQAKKPGILDRLGAITSGW